MKIVYVHKDINQSINAGGINTVYLKHIERLQDKHDIYVITSRDGEWNLKAKRFIVSSDNEQRKIEIEKNLNEIKPDIIDVFSWGAELLDYSKKERSSKLVMRADIPMRYYSREPIDEEMAYNCDKVISISNWCDFEWSSTLGGDTSVVPHATDMEKSDMAKKKNTVVWVGKSTYIKGFDLLLKLPDEFFKKFELTIICAPTKFDDAKMFEVLKKKGAIIKSNLSPEDYRNQLAQSEFVLSTARKEGFCIAVLEAMKVGCIPVVPYWIGGTTDFVNSTNGIVYRNLNDCFEKMKNLKNSEEKRKKAIITSDEYNWDSVVRMSEKIYEEIVNAN